MNVRNELHYLWKYVSAMPWWLRVGATRRPFEWVAVNEDEHDTDYVEPWNRQTWMALRPRYWGLLKKLPCGCSRRLGRMVLYVWRCPVHSRWMDV